MSQESRQRQRSSALEDYLQVLQRRFPVQSRPLQAQTERLAEEDPQRKRAATAPSSVASVEMERNFGSEPPAGGDGTDAAVSRAELARMIREREDAALKRGRDEGREEERKESTRRALESDGASRRQIVERFALADLAERCRTAGIGAKVEEFASRLDALEKLSTSRASSADSALVGLRAEREDAVVFMAVALSEEFYALIGELRIRMRAGDAFTPLQFNESGQRLAKAMNERLFGGRAVLVAEPEGVSADDTLHTYASGSAGQPMQPCTFRVLSSEGTTKRRAVILPQRGGGG